MRITENYRGDIDGLRAIAVLAVIAFHFGLLRNGFLGVDVFFVISGFLITRNIVDQVGAGRFSLADFYARRVRRIVPLTLLVGLVVLPVGVATMLPDDLENLAQSLIATNLFGNNILQAVTTRNYWDIVNEYKPLMHTWSLGIEEQYYAVYPLLFVLLAGRRRWWLPALLGLTAASLLAYLAPLGTAADKFYLMPFRFWELALGGLVALKPVRFGALRAGAALAGAALLPVLLYAELGGLDPRAALLLVALSTAAVIDGAPLAGGHLAAVLGCRPLRWIGKLSFGMYMWHQPLLAYARYVFSHEPNLAQLALIAALTVVLALLGHALVEEPLRDRRRTTGRQLGAFVGLLLALTMVPSLYLYQRAGVFRDVPELGIVAAQSGRNVHAQYNDRIHAFDREFAGTGTTRVLVVGNSLARDWANVLLESRHGAGLEISYVSDPRGELARRRAAQADLVFISPKFADLAPLEIESSRSWILGPKNFGTSNGLFYNHRGTDYLQQRTPLIAGVWQRNLQWRQRAGDHYIDYLAKLVDADLTVPVFTPEGRFISQDCRHLTRAGAQHVARLFDAEIAALVARARPADPGRAN